VSKKKKGTAGVTAKPRKSVPRSKRHSRGQEPILVDARNVSKAARAVHKGFRAYDAERKVKLLPTSRLDAFDALIKSGATLIGGARARKAVTKGATQTEHRARLVVWNLVQEARGLVNLAVTDDATMREAFLVGADVKPVSTTSLVKAAGDIEQAWKQPQYRERATALGITKGMVGKLAAARRALTAADTTQRGEIATRVGATSNGKSTLRKIELETAYIRRVAKRAFKGDEIALLKFQKTIPKAIARKPKSTPQAPEPPPAKPPA
jgi:hypothetical protein